MPVQETPARRKRRPQRNSVPPGDSNEAAVLKVNLNDGRTLRYDLNSSADAADWASLARNHAFQAQITGLSISLNGVSYSLPRPKDFGDEIFLFAEHIEEDRGGRIKGGERAFCNAGNTQVVLMVHASQRAVRVDVTRPGKMRYNPYHRRGSIEKIWR